MGNEESLHEKIEVEEEAVEVTENWSLRYAKEKDGKLISHSAFVSQTKILERKNSPLEIFAKNLKIYRHPCILKYITSWNQNNKLFLITEEVKPLPLLIINQTPLEICMGLYNVLSALIFLHEKAKASHNNVCCASIYVTPEGVWKLGGLQFLKKFSELSSDCLKESRACRYEKAVAPEEDSFHYDGSVNAEGIDKYAFGILVEELLKKKTNAELPSVVEFREFCRKRLVEPKPESRADLKQVLSHTFFNHNFVKISKFLFDLPLKSNYEKQGFFRDLTEQLHLLPEEVVGSQLAASLLSRVVLLDQTAQKHLLPVLLRPGEGRENQRKGALFSEKIFKKYVVPKLLHVIRVRDAQIRLILLDHFHLFCDSFSSDELRFQVLPELLVGVKDVDDKLVSKTLKALSLLVMILGASTVIGGKRGKLFTDGRPKSNSVPDVKDEIKADFGSRATPGAGFGDQGLPERLSPDGGEDASSGVAAEVEGEPESWSDWDAPVSEESPKIGVQKLEEIEGTSSATFPRGKEVSLPDITSLDIKCGVEEGSSFAKDVDFFRDMEPVISKTQILRVVSKRTKFDVESADEENNWEGWREDWELGEVS